MSYSFYTTTQKAWSWMIESIKKAKKSIYIEMYIFLDDTWSSHDFIWEIKNKLKEWLEVIIVVDIVWSFFLKKNTIQQLRDLGAEICFFSHFLRRTHRKILIIDQKIAFLWWVNVKRWSKDWHDLQIKFSWWFLLNPLLKSFSYTYKMAGWKNEKILDINQKSFIKKMKSWIVENRWRKDNIYHLNNYYRDKIFNAKKTITVVTPYLVPPRWMIALLDAAVYRGVNISFIIPKDTDIKIINHINYYYAKRLRNLWIKFYFTKKMNHAKLMIIDWNEAIVWSQNIDFLSFDMNAEIWVFFQDKKAIKNIEIIINDWIKKSEVCIPDKNYLGIWSNIFKFFLKLFSPIL